MKFLKKNLAIALRKKLKKKKIPSFAFKKICDTHLYNATGTNISFKGVKLFYEMSMSVLKE